MNTSLQNIDFEPLTEVKAKLSEKIARLNQNGRLLAVTVNGKPKAMLVPYDAFLKTIQKPESKPRLLSLKEWRKESKQRRKVIASINNLFDLSLLERKGQKPYKQDALKKLRKS